MRNIGDSHQEAPSAAGGLAIHRVVEVAGIGAIDGHERHIPEVCAPLLVALGNVLLVLRDLPLDFLWPGEGNGVGMNGDIGGDPFLLRLTDDLHDAAGRLLHVGRIIQYAGNDDLSRLRVARFSLRNEHAVRDFRIIRHDYPDTAFQYELTRDVPDPAFENFDHLAFRAAAVVAADDLDRNAITVDQRAHLPRRKVDIVLAVLAQDETEAVAVSADHACDQFELLRQAKLATPVPDDLPCANHPVERIEQGLLRTLALQPEVL